MNKRFTALSMSMLLAMGAYAYNVDDYVYTSKARYKLTGENIINNGTFTAGTTGLDGWTATAGGDVNAEVFSVESLAEGRAMLVAGAGSTPLTMGVKQIVPIEYEGTYVVTMKVMGANDGFTDLMLVKSGTNYINAYYNTDGEMATVGGTNKRTQNFGTGGINGGREFSFGTTDFTEVTFAIENAGADGFITIDLRGLEEGVKVADIEVHQAERVSDDRVARRRLDYINTVLAGHDFSEADAYIDVQEAITQLREELEGGSDDLATSMENLDMMWSEFTFANLSNVIEFIPGADGTSTSGNASADWTKWTGKSSTSAWTLYSNAGGSGRWSYSTASNALRLQWLKNATGPWDNTATLTATLDKGTYFFGMSATGGHMTQNTKHYTVSEAAECGVTSVFFDTSASFDADNRDSYAYLDTVMLSPSIVQDYIYCVKVADDNTTVHMGFRSNPLNESLGYTASFTAPVLYKVLEPDALTPEQEAYLSGVDRQLEAMAARLKVASAYVADSQSGMPWGKDLLAESIAASQAQYDSWAGLSQSDILNHYFYDQQELADTISRRGTAVVNAAINDYLNLNIPFTSLAESLDMATATLGMRLYESATRKQDLQAAIAGAQALYDEKLTTTAFSEADSTLLADKRAELEAEVELFKQSLSGVTSLIDIDFGTTEAPVSVITETDETSGETTHYVQGAKGRMTLSTISGDNRFELGYRSDSNSDVATDSLGMLRVGNGTASVDLTALSDYASAINTTDIVKIEFDYYFAQLQNRNSGFYIYDAEDNVIGGLYFCEMNNISGATLNTFGVTNVVATSGALKVADRSNRTHFEIVLDYGARQMYCTTTTVKGSTAGDAVAMTTQALPAKFTIASNHNNYGPNRRCWFDNLTIDVIKANATAINGVTARTGADNGATYNLQGQKVSTTLPGRIYIKNGKKIAF